MVEIRRHLTTSISDKNGRQKLDGGNSQGAKIEVHAQRLLQIHVWFRLMADCKI
jgi:hypothetical protein